MNLITTLDAWDKQLMLLINHDGGSWADHFWYLYSGKVAWIGVAALIIFTLVRVRACRRECVLTLLTTVLVCVLADQISASVIKPLVARLRPSHCDEIAAMLHYVNDYHGGRYGFVSSHAANSVAIVTWLCLLFKGRWVRTTLILWAVGNCYSRLYLGVHYPGDIVCGALLGLLCGVAGYQIYRYGVGRLGLDAADLKRIEQDRSRRSYWIYAPIIGTWLILFILAGVQAL